MAEEEDDTTYRYVEPSARSVKRPSGRPAAEDPPTQKRPRASRSQRSTPIKRARSAPDTVVGGESPIPATVDDPEPPSSETPSRHVLGVDEVGTLLERGEYQRVCDLLGPAERAESLPPKLALLYVIARSELGHGPELADLPHLAMETSGAILGVPARSRTARLLAKKLLGLSDHDVRSRMASRPMQLGLLALAVIAGAVLGWLAGPGWAVLLGRG